MSWKIPEIIKKRRIKTDRITKVISVKEFAIKNHISTQSVYYWLATNRIKGYKAKGRWWIYLQTQ